MVKPSRYERTKFCPGKDCHKKYRNEFGMSQEQKDKISKTKGGVKTDVRICEECGVEFKIEKWKKNRFHSRECGMRHVGKNTKGCWNRGLTKENNDKLADLGNKHSASMLNKYALGDIDTWNKGLTKTDPRVAKYVQSQTNWRNTPSLAKDAWKKAMSVAQVKAHAAGKYPFTFTKPEKLTWTYLESLGYVIIEFKDKSDSDPPNCWYHQYDFFGAFVPDFVCPDLKYVLEVDGCFIHGHDLNKCKHRTAKYGWTKIAEDNRKRDRRKHSMYYRKGWKWANVWECEAELGDFHRITQYLT